MRSISGADFDGTIVNINSTREFLKFLSERRTNSSFFLKIGLLLEPLIFNIFKKSWNLNSRLLLLGISGWTEQRIELTVKDFWDQTDYRVNKQLLKKIESDATNWVIFSYGFNFIILEFFQNIEKKPKIVAQDLVLEENLFYVKDKILKTGKAHYLDSNCWELIEYYTDDLEADKDIVERARELFFVEKV